MRRKSIADSSDLENSSDSIVVIFEDVGEEKYAWEGKRIERDDSPELLGNINWKHTRVDPDRKELVDFEEKGNDLRDSSGETLNLTIWFGKDGRAVRKISCKASDYPTDIVERIKNMYIKMPDIEIKDLFLCKNPRGISPRDRDGSDRVKYIGLPHRTLDELGITEYSLLLLMCKNVTLDWIPLPVTGDEVWI